jgi:hypothetical protein
MQHPLQAAGAVTEVTPLEVRIGFQPGNSAALQQAAERVAPG